VLVDGKNSVCSCRVGVKSDIGDSTGKEVEFGYEVPSGSAVILQLCEVVGSIVSGSGIVGGSRGGRCVR